MTRDEFFNKLETGAKWDVGVSIARTNPLPLDANEIFKSVADMETYIKENALAYPGQIVVVLGETETSAYLVNTVGGEGKGYSKLAAVTGSGDIVEELNALAQRVSTIESYFEAGVAKKANADAEGNVIKDTYATITSVNAISDSLGDYAKLEGAAFTGAVTVQTPTADANPATKKYVDDAIGGITGFDYQIVDSLADLPTTGTKGVIYLVPDEHGAQDVYDEYIWVGDKYEKIGNTDINLDGYVKGTDLTVERIVLGDGNSNVKTSDVGIVTTVATTADDSNVVTGGAVKRFVEGKGYLVAADLTDYAKTEDVTSATDTAKTELEGEIATKQTEDQVKALISAAEIQGTQVKGNVAQATLADTATVANKVVNALTVGTKTFDGSEAVTIVAADLDALTEVPVATDSAVGGFKTGFAQTATKRAVQISAEEGTEGQAYVEVPEGVTYTAGEGLVLSDNEFSLGDVSTDKLVQGSNVLILNGGSATV